jgi:hypothetical protein
MTVAMYTTTCTFATLVVMFQEHVLPMSRVVSFVRVALFEYLKYSSSTALEKVLVQQAILAPEVLLRPCPLKRAGGARSLSLRICSIRSQPLSCKNLRKAMRLRILSTAARIKVMTRSRLERRIKRHYTGVRMGLLFSQMRLIMWNLAQILMGDGALVLVTWKNTLWLLLVVASTV